MWDVRCRQFLNDLGLQLESMSAAYCDKIWKHYTKGNNPQDPELNNLWKQFFADTCAYDNIQAFLERAPKGRLKRELQLWKYEFLERKIASDKEVKIFGHKARASLSEVTLSVAGSKFELREYWGLLMKEKSRSFRQALWHEREKISKRCEPEITNYISRLNEVSSGLGLGSYYDFSLRKSEIERSFLVESIERFEVETRKIAETAIADLCEILGTDCVEPWDIEYGRHLYLQESQKLFSPEKAIDTLLSCCDGLGFQRHRHSIKIDCEPRGHKAPGCFFLAVKIPDDLRVVVNQMPGDRFYLDAYSAESDRSH